MKRLAAVLLLLGGVASAEPRPLLTLEQHYMPGGGRRTLFVAYDDGLAIYSTRKRGTELGSGYAQVMLDDSERKYLVDHLPDDVAWKALPPNGDAAPGTFDGVWQQVCVFRGGEKRCVGLRGLLHEGAGDRGRAPALFLEVYDRYASYTHPRGKPWAPERVPVKLWVSRQKKAVPWPARWNAPIVPIAGARAGQEPSATTSVPGRDLRALQLIADDHKAVDLAGKRYDLQYTVALPGEDRWTAR